MASSQHQLQSAFMCSSIHGWIYLEMTMNEHLNCLLKCMPRIVWHQNGITQEQIDFGDWMRMLTMLDTHTSIAVGKWVQVCRGIYKGNVGYVSAFENWGGVSLLLVPHLLLPWLLGMSASKRKCGTTSPKPELFDPVTVRCNYGWNPIPIYQADSCYVCNHIVFKHGLIIKTFDLHSISLNSVYILTNLFFLLQHSPYPHLLTSKFSKPLEWVFEEGKQVVILSSSKHGIIKAVGADATEVELDNGEGVVSTS